MREAAAAFAVAALPFSGSMPGAFQASLFVRISRVEQARVPSEPEPTVVGLLLEFQACRLEARWDGMRELLHPTARLESLAAPDRVLSPDELVGAIRNAAARGLYSVPIWQPSKLTEHAGLVEGRVRYRVGATGLNDERRLWLTTKRDGLIWRMRIFRERSHAIQCLDDHGDSLGI